MGIVPLLLSYFNTESEIEPVTAFTEVESAADQ